MAEVNAKDLTTKTAPASTDSMLLFGTTTNEGAKITVDNLANNILERLATKTFPNQVGGSSAATILAQLATLNSNIPTFPRTWTLSNQTPITEQIDAMSLTIGQVKHFYGNPDSDNTMQAPSMGSFEVFVSRVNNNNILLFAITNAATIHTKRKGSSGWDSAWHNFTSS